MNVRFSKVAQADLRSAVAYIAERNPWAARRLSDAIVAAVTKLSDFPLMGTQVGDLRRLVCGNYLIFYEVTKREVIVTRIIHGARALPPQLPQDD